MVARGANEAERSFGTSRHDFIDGRQDCTGGQASCYFRVVGKPCIRFDLAAAVASRSLQGLDVSLGMDAEQFLVGGKTNVRLLALRFLAGPIEMAQDCGQSFRTFRVSRMRFVVDHSLIGIERNQDSPPGVEMQPTGPDAVIVTPCGTGRKSFHVKLGHTIAI